MEKETIQKEAEILMRDFMERAQHAKTEMCRSEAMSDNPALLIVVFEPKQDEFEGDWESLAEGCKEMGLSRTLQCGMIPLIHKQDPAECLTDVIGSFPLDKFEYAFIAVEGYAERHSDKKKAKPLAKSEARELKAMIDKEKYRERRRKGILNG